MLVYKHQGEIITTVKTIVDHSKIAQVLVYKHFDALLKLIVMKKWAMSELLKSALVFVCKHLGTFVKLIVTNVWAMSELLKSAQVLVYKHLGTLLNL